MRANLLQAYFKTAKDEWKMHVEVENYACFEKELKPLESMPFCQGLVVHLSTACFDCLSDVYCTFTLFQNISSTWEICILVLVKMLASFLVCNFVFSMFNISIGNHILCYTVENNILAYNVPS